MEKRIKRILNLLITTIFVILFLMWMTSLFGGDPVRSFIEFIDYFSKASLVEVILIMIPIIFGSIIIFYKIIQINRITRENYQKIKRKKLQEGEAVPIKDKLSLERKRFREVKEIVLSGYYEMIKILVIGGIFLILPYLIFKYLHSITSNEIYHTIWFNYPLFVGCIIIALIPIIYLIGIFKNLKK